MAYGKYKGASFSSMTEDPQQIGFFFGNWFIEVSTNKSTEVNSTGVAYVGVGNTNDDYRVPYVTGITSLDNQVTVANGITIPEAALGVIDPLIDYMKAHPDPTKKPKLSGVKFVKWSELYPNSPR